jgi:LPS sulfotransferase NodH
MDPDGYFICATPRTGSSLLCGLLGSTGVAGRPESYFRSEDEAMWARQWGIAMSNGTVDYQAFVGRAIIAGSTDNGVFAARLMWGTLPEIINQLRTARPDGSRLGDLQVLRETFGPLRFVYLQRRDRLAQAVSWSRAEQTDVWYQALDGDRPSAKAEPTFDRSQIEHLLAVIDEHNRAWQEWFARTGVVPHAVHYEDLDRDPAGTTRGVLASLGLDDAGGAQPQVRHRRLADRLNTAWMDRYRSRS